VVFTHCAGVDVHQKTVMACRVTPDPTGQQADGIMERQQFGTMPRALLALSDWLAEVGVPHGALESTGAYWRPVSNLLEGNVTIFRVNAAHGQQVPGRKTDKAAARWLAKLRRDGLLPARFLPPQPQRDRRDLTRDRTKVVPERRRAINRLQGVLERANLKLAAGATDIMGVSGRAILAALIQGRADPATMAERAQDRMRPKLPWLEQALSGLLRDHHRRLWTLPLTPSDFLDEQIDALSIESTRGLGELEAARPALPDPAERRGAMASTGDGDILDPPRLFAPAIAVLDTLPGVDRRGAELLVAEWGTDMRRFGTASRLSAWAGVAPGRDERAGKQRSGKTRRGNRTLRTGLTQMAHAAARTKGTSRFALYQRLAARRGKKRAVTAVAHAIVVSAFHMLARQEPYRELGANYFDAQPRGHLLDRFTRRIAHLVQLVINTYSISGR
jgi:transposase